MIKKLLSFFIVFLICFSVYAGTTTTNHALYKPTAKETGWAALVNANMDTIDDLLYGFDGAGNLLVTGNVGVGTTVPYTSAALNVVGNGYFYTAGENAILDVATDYGKIRLQSNIGGNYLYSTNNASSAPVLLGISTVGGSTVNILMATNGYVGIGTNNPGVRLSVCTGANCAGKSGTVLTDPAIYVAGSLGVDGSVYCTDAKATTGYRTLCIDSVGKLFSVVSPTTCGAGT